MLSWMTEICENPLSAGSLISGLGSGGQGSWRANPGLAVNQGAWEISSGPVTLSEAAKSVGRYFNFQHSASYANNL